MTTLRLHNFYTKPFDSSYSAYSHYSCFSKKNYPLLELLCVLPKLSTSVFIIFAFVFSLKAYRLNFKSSVLRHRMICDFQLRSRMYKKFCVVLVRWDFFLLTLTNARRVEGHLNLVPLLKCVWKTGNATARDGIAQ